MRSFLYISCRISGVPPYVAAKMGKAQLSRSVEESLGLRSLLGTSPGAASGRVEDSSRTLSGPVPRRPGEPGPGEEPEEEGPGEDEAGEGWSAEEGVFEGDD